MCPSVLCDDARWWDRGSDCDGGVAWRHGSGQKAAGADTGAAGCFNAGAACQSGEDDVFIQYESRYSNAHECDYRFCHDCGKPYGTDGSGAGMFAENSFLKQSFTGTD